MPSPVPTDITYHQKSKVLEIVFSTGERFELPAEYLRVHSPSAEVRGHGPGQEILQVGKENVTIEQVEQVGNYAVRLYFSDGHHTGLYSWDELHRLGRDHERLWSEYLARLKKSGHKRVSTDPAGQGPTQH